MPILYCCVLTILTGLEAKCLVRREKGPVGKAFVYLPTERSKPTGGNVLNRILQRVFHGDGVALVTSLFQSKPPSRAELDRLEQLLHDLRTPRSEKKKAHDS